MLLAHRQLEWTPPPNSDEPIPVFNQRPAALGFTITFMILAWLCSILRLYTRVFILGAPGWDDLFIVLTLMATTVGSVVFCVIQDYGMGRHIETMTTDEINVFMKIFYVGNVSYPLSLTFIKVALLFQYLRIFDVGSRRRTICKWLIGFCFVWGLFYSVNAWVPCYPVSALWDFGRIKAGTRFCWGVASSDLSQALGFYISQSVSTTLLDFIIFLLPAHLFFKPDTQKKTRVSLLCLFGLGLVVNFCSICRLVYSLRPTLDALWDLTWNSPSPTGLAVIEICLATVCAALPVFWPVLLTSWGRILVTYEVVITREYGVFVPRKKKKELPPQTASSDRDLTSGESTDPSDPSHLPGWDPYVGDAKTGLGETETYVESPAERPVRKGKKELSFMV